MHSMHVDAFFEYLLDRPNVYWTDIPADQNPVCESGRDGVAAEDDMALRSLLPHIRPRRGKRKPEDEDTNKSPSQRPSMEPPPTGNDLASAHPNAMDAWSARPDARGSVFLFPVSDQLRLTTGIGQPSGPPWVGHNEALQTPMTAYPQSAITPSTRHVFWADEPKSAITPSKTKMNKRHGAKVVSSAWRSGLGGTGKTRGRPRLNRDGNQDGPFSAFPSAGEPTFRVPMPVAPNLALMTSPTALQPPSGPTTPVVNSPTPTGPHPIPNPRPAKRSRLSLQVPERIGGEVRLATPPPPAVTVNGQVPTTVDYRHPQGPSYTNAPTMKLVGPPQAADAAAPAQQSSSGPPPPAPPPPQAAAFSAGQKPGGLLGFGDAAAAAADRTNMDALEGFFLHEILTADWFDASGRPVPPCGADEALAMVQTVVENLLRAADTKEAFLINLAALAGGKVLMSGTTNLRLDRLEEGERANRYRCTWELRLGDIRGLYSMEETVETKRWKKEEEEAGAETAEALERARRESTLGREDDGGGGSAEHWRSKYVAMCEAVKKRDRELAEVRLKVARALREPRGDGKG